MSVERAHRLIAVAGGLTNVALELAVLGGAAHEDDAAEVGQERLATIAALLRAYARTIEERP